MDDLIKKRVIKETNYIINNKSTIRDTAKKFNISKSTVYDDLTNKIFKIDKSKLLIINNIFKNNFKEKHIRGGISTKNKYRGNI